jgi:hypothetical protein
LRLSFLTRLRERGVKTIFVADVRAVSRVSDVKAEQYAAYFKLADAVVVNNTTLFTRNTAPYTIRRVSTPKDLHWEAVAKAIIRNRHNKDNRGPLRQGLSHLSLRAHMILNFKKGSQILGKKIADLDTGEPTQQPAALQPTPALATSASAAEPEAPQPGASALQPSEDWGASSEASRLRPRGGGAEACGVSRQGGDHQGA